MLIDKLKELFRGNDQAIGLLSAEIEASEKVKTIARRTEVLREKTETTEAAEKKIPELRGEMEKAEKKVKDAGKLLGAAQKELNAAILRLRAFSFETDRKINAQDIILVETAPPEIDAFIDEMTKLSVETISAMKRIFVPESKPDAYGVKEPPQPTEYPKLVETSLHIKQAILAAKELKITVAGDVTATLENLRRKVTAGGASDTTTDLH